MTEMQTVSSRIEATVKGAGTFVDMRYQLSFRCHLIDQSPLLKIFQ